MNQPRKGSNIELKPSVDLGILAGLLLTDGCVSKPRFLVFHNKSDEMHSLFRQKVQSVFNHNRFTTRLEKNLVKRTQVNSKSIVRELTNFCKIKTFRRKRFENGNFPDVKLPDFIKSLSKSEICKVLQAVFSADGSISVSVRWHKRNKAWEIRRRIELTCVHPILRENFFELLKIVDFSPVISGENITIEKKNDILKFSNDVRFVPKLKISRNSKCWEGFEKNRILDLAVKTLNFKKRDLEKFESKEEVINFLKSLVPTSKRVV